MGGGTLVSEKRGGCLRDAETEGRKDSDKRTTDILEEKEYSIERQTEEGRGGRKCRKRRERNITTTTQSPFSGRKGRGGNKSPTEFLPPLFRFWRGICPAEVGCFKNLSAIPPPAYRHPYTWKPAGLQVGSLRNGGYRAWGPLC